MSRSVRVALLVCVLVVSTSPDALAFDGDRKGFVLGFGAGPGTFEREAPDARYITSLHTNLKFGVGLTDQLLIYYSGHTAVAFVDKSWRRLFLSPSIAAAYYLTPRSPAFYFLGEFGITLDFDNYMSGEIAHVAVGPSLAVGTGLEVFRHVTIEFAADWVFSSDPYPGGKEVYTVYTLTLGLMAF